MKNATLEQSINEMSFKLDKKKKKLRAVKENEFILKEKSSSLE
jgi:hypothetical protein